MSDGLTVRALVAGLAATLIGGIVWAVVVIATHYELGWIAWALGALVGWAMARAAGGMDARLAWPAAGLAFLGLGVGKILILSVGAVNSIAREIEQYPDAVRAVAFQELIDTRGFPPEIQGILDTLSDEATPDSATIDSLLAVVDRRVEVWQPAQRDSLIRAYARAEYELIPWGERLRVSLSLYDILWAGLAIATAWRLAGGATPPSGPESGAESGPEGVDVGV